MKKRTKLLLGILIGVLVLLVAGTYALAKVGVIKLGILADTLITNQAEMEINVQDENGGPFGEGLPVTATYNNNIDDQELTVRAVENDGTVTTKATLRNLVPNTSYAVDVKRADCNKSTTFKTGANGETNRVKYNFKVVCGSSAQNTFSISGFIRDKSNFSAIIGATASQVGGPSSQPTTALGQFTISGINFTNSANVASLEFQFSASGYKFTNPSDPTKLTATLDQLGVPSRLITPGGTWSVGTIAMVKTTTTTTPPPIADTFSFSGKVVSGSVGIPNAIVTVGGGSFASQQQTTDQNGIFTFTNFPIIHPNNITTNPSTGSLYALKAQATGYAAYAKTLGDHGIASITKGQSYKLNPDINLAMDKNTVYIYGTVKDNAEKLIPGAPVTSTFGTVTASRNSEVNLIKSTIPGDYNYIIPLPVAINSTSIGKPINIDAKPPTGYTGTFQSVVNIPSAANYVRKDITFTAAIAKINFSGKVYDDKGTPMAGISLAYTTSGASDSTRTQDGSGGTSFPLGSFKFFNVPKAKLSVTLSNLPVGFTVDGGETQDVDLSAATGTESTHDFKLKSQAVSTNNVIYYGSVLDENEKLVPDFKLITTGNDPVSCTSSLYPLATPGVTASHNFALILPKDSNLPYTTSIPTGYELVSGGATGNLDLRGAPATVGPKVFRLKHSAAASVSVKIAGKVFNSKTGSMIDGVKIKVISFISSDKTLSTADATSYSEISLDGTKVNFISTKLLESDQDKYLIALEKSGYNSKVVAIQGVMPNNALDVIIPNISLTPVTKNWLGIIVNGITSFVKSTLNFVNTLWGRLTNTSASDYDYLMKIFNDTSTERYKI